MGQKTTLQTEDGQVVKAGNPQEVGGDSFKALAEMLHQILDQQKITNELLKGILQ